MPWKARDLILSISIQYSRCLNFCSFSLGRRRVFEKTMLHLVMLKAILCFLIIYFLAIAARIQRDKYT
jgi:hypothetical protein